MILSELNVSDGQITEFTTQSDIVTIIFKDWQENTYTIVFKDVIGVEAYSPENIDLSYIKVTSKSNSLKKVCSIVEEDENGITEYSFISAWNDLSILNIFGVDVEITR